MITIFYSYYSNPWLKSNGDEVRISFIVDQFIRKGFKVIVLTSSIKHDKLIIFKDKGAVYIIYPREAYKLIARLLKWRDYHDLNPLWKVTLYLDELLTSIMILRLIRIYEKKSPTIIYVFGSMSLLPWLLRIFSKLIPHKKRWKIVYDPLANYAQTLYLRSRYKAIELLRYALYLTLHKLSIHASDIIVYPSRLDRENAEKMFKLKKGYKTLQIVPNPPPICFNSVNEYLRLRKLNRKGDPPHFLLLAGGRGEHNRDAVRMTLQAFKDLPPEKFRLFVSGPWTELKHLVKNPSIKFLGVVPHVTLKGLIASCDYGLSPIFLHSSGTSIKVITYLTGGLRIIASPQSLAGIDPGMLKRAKKIYLVRNFDEYRHVIEMIVNDEKHMVNEENPQILMCNEYILSLDFAISRD